MQTLTPKVSSSFIPHWFLDPSQVQSQRAIQVQSEAISAQLAAKQAELDKSETTAASMLKVATSAALAVSKASIAVSAAKKTFEAAQQHALQTTMQVSATQQNAAALREDIRLLTAALLPLTLSMALVEPDQQRKLSVQLIHVTSDKLEDVLLQMSKSDTPAIFDFQGKDMSYSKNTNPTLRADAIKWRNGTIMLSEKTRLDVTGAGVELEDIIVTGGGGVRVLDCGSLTMTDCEVRDAVNGLSLDGNGKLVAESVNISNCSMTGILLEGSSLLVAEKICVSQCVWTGIGIHGSSSLVATDMKISGTNDGITLAGTSTADVNDCVLEDIREDGIWMTGATSMIGKDVNTKGILGHVLRLKDTASLTLTASTLTNSTGKIGAVMECSSLVLSGCTVGGKFKKDDTAFITRKA